MLRRALLTVALLSCTLRESIYANDLTCVLFLSGLQRNDSDDDALRKLHGRNENIHGANNEKLEREFLLNSSRIANMEQMKIIKAPPRTSTVELSTKEICRNPKKNENDLKRNSNVARGRRTVASEEDVEVASTSIENDYTQNNNNSENDINNLSRTKHRLKNIRSDKSTKVIRYTKEEPNLRRVITFWQNLVSRKRDTITENATLTTSTKVNKKYNTIQAIRVSNITTPKNHQAKIKDRTTLVVNKGTNTENSILGNEYLKNILNEYTSKEEIPSQGSTTDKTNVNTSLDDDTDIFDYLLNRHDTEGSETHKFNARMSKYSYEFKFTKIKCPIETLKKEKENQKSIQRDRELSAMFIRDFQDLEKNVLNKNKKTTLRYPITSEEDYDKYNADRNISVKPKHTEFRMNNKLSSTTLPPEMIKQIAENVKKLIIKDFHTEVITSTKGITTATTTGDMVSNKNNIVIEKIMEILRQYKTDNNIDATHTTDTIEITVHSTSKVRHHPKAHSVKDTKKTGSPPYANYPYIFPSHKKIPARTILENLKRQQPLIPKRHLPPLINTNIGKDFKSRPITFQTNLIEIPPLGVPVSDPVLPLSHNIIITTSPPYFQQLQMFPNRHDSLFKSHLTSNKLKTVQKNNIFKHSNINNNERGSNKKKPTEYRTRHHDSDNNTDDEGLKRNTYKKNKKPFEHRTRTNGGDDNTEEGGLRQNTARYKNGPRFHEKLENYQHSNMELEATSGEDCCKDEIFTREQRPIKHAEKENVSFKKLLKTQQRVTEMLERMLAKSKAEQPISVETT